MEKDEKKEKSSLRKENIVLHEGDYTQIRLAVWFGNESKGISKLAIEKSKFCVNIPMYGIIESLNLATSTGIVLYEVTKQRREFQKKYKRGQKKYQRKTKFKKEEKLNKSRSHNKG